MTKTTWKQIDWKKVLLHIFRVFFPIPLLFIIIGIGIFETVSDFSDGIKAGLITTQTDNNTIFLFTGFILGFQFISTGLIIVYINLLEDTSKNEVFIKKIE